MRTGNIPNMDLGIGIGPGNGDQDIFRHSCLRNSFTTKGTKGTKELRKTFVYFVSFVFNGFGFTNKKAVRKMDSPLL